MRGELKINVVLTEQRELEVSTLSGGGGRLTCPVRLTHLLYRK